MIPTDSGICRSYNAEPVHKLFKPSIFINEIKVLLITYRVTVGSTVTKQMKIKKKEKINKKYSLALVETGEIHHQSLKKKNVSI